MSATPRLLVAAATTLVALGAGAAPGLASGRSQAAQEALKLQPTVQEDIGPTRTAAQKRATAAALLMNAKQCDHVAGLESRTHPASIDGRDLWVKGMRLQASGDRELAAGLRLELAGDTAAGRRKVNAAENPRDAPLNLANLDVVHADKSLGIFGALGKAENG